MRKIIFLLLLLIIAQAKAQEPFYTSYNWENNPNYKNLETDINKDLISFKDKTINEFIFTKDNSLVEYYLEHNLLWLNSDDRIEEYNKIYLPYNSNSELLVNKARVITKNGTVLELDESKILTAINEETKREYKYFAFEGVEKGSFIEYYYVVKRYPDYKGKRLTFQSSFDKYNSEFDLFSPKNLIFNFKSYNGLNTVEQDTLTTDKLHWKLYTPVINKLEEEDQSAYNASKQYLVYKLESNTYSNTHGISSYSNTSKNVYDYLFAELTKNEKTSIQKIIQESKIENEKDDISKIRTFENFMKQNFFYSENSSDELGSISSVISNKAGSETGLMRVYIAALRQIGISVDIVLTSNRFETKFDPKFEANNFLTDYLLYFPSVDKFTSVEKMESRLGFPPSEFTDNYGLFIKEISVGNYKSGVGKIKYIIPPTIKDTFDNMLIEVKFDKEDLGENLIMFDRTFGGYYAQYIQPYIHLINKDEIDQLYTSLLKSVNENMTIIDKKVYNDKSELFGIKPFQIVANIKTDAFVDKAGTKYLFKMGELIGPQIEMYQKNERNLAVESDYQRIYNRVITVEIPEGYKISNLKDINLQKFHKKDGEKVFEFHSYFEINNNILKIYANEYYKLNRVETEHFEAYKDVINSAADFNKIVLVLEPN